jgi:hypothetical protein
MDIKSKRCGYLVLKGISRSKADWPFGKIEFNENYLRITAMISGELCTIQRDQITEFNQISFIFMKRTEVKFMEENENVYILLKGFFLHKELRNWYKNS